MFRRHVIRKNPSWPRTDPVTSPRTAAHASSSSASRTTAGFFGFRCGGGKSTDATYARARVEVREYEDGGTAVFRATRELGRYDRRGRPVSSEAEAAA